MAAELDPMELIRGELSDDGDAASKVAALRRLGLVASGLGAPRARQELVPFLDTFARSSGVDEDLAALAEGLAGVAPQLGGAEHVGLLIPALEFLCMVEETAVRTAAVASLVKITPQLSDRDVVARAFPMVKRLAAADFFPPRHAATGLFKALYVRASDDVRAELRGVYVQLINDEAPIVRRAAFLNLADFSTVISSESIRSDFVPILRGVARDDSDGTRRYAPACAAGFCAALSHEDSLQVVLPIAEALADDSSWRVREQLVLALPLLCERNGPEGRDRLLPLYVKLLQDAEPNLRLEAVRKMQAIGDACGAQIADHVGPVLDVVADDSFEMVRVSLSESVVHLSRTVGRDTAQQVVLPLCQRLAKDELPDVRHNILTQIEELVEVLGPDTAVDAVLPTVLALAADPKWRVRSEVIHKVCVLSERLGVKVFEEKLQPVVINGLADHVFAIRDMAARQVCELVRFFGAEWAADKLFPAALSVFDSSTNYLHRMTSLTIVENVAQYLGAPAVQTHLLPIVETACKDDVANVRLAAANAAAAVAVRLDPAMVDDRLRALVTDMTADTDTDVNYASRQALVVFDQHSQSA